jgi:ABC-2 type transport system permease protein
MSEGVRSNVLLPVWSLFLREIVRFLRQRGRILGALGTPLLFWVVLGSGFGSSLRPAGLAGDVSYLTFFFPGTLLLVVLFTAIFSSISVIQDRTEGFLQGVLAAPVPRISIVLGKVLGGGVLGFGQGVLLLLLGPLAGVDLSVATFLGACGVLLLTAIGLSALGFLFAWRMDSVQSFHAVMNLLMFPMWLMSGAFFPAAGASVWVQWIMRLNPLAYGLAALRAILQGTAQSEAMGDPAWAVSVSVLAAFAAGCVILAAALAGNSELKA